jgi:TrmH family RNA methyltransferase
MPQKRKPSNAYLERRSMGIGKGNSGDSESRRKQRNINPESEAAQGGFISSLDNDKAKFVRLLQNKRERYAARHFLIEGVRLVREAFQAPTKPLYTLYEPEILRKTEAGRGLLITLVEMVEEKKGVFPVTDKVIASISDTVTPQGIAAAMPFLRWENEQLASKNVHLVLDGVQDPGNLGTILRSAWAAGNSAVWLTEDAVDIYSPKVVRAGMGAHFHVPSQIDQKWPDLLQRLKEMGITQILLAEGEITQEGESKANFKALPSVTYYEVDWTQPTAVIIGNEAHGPGREGWEAATGLLRIPMPGGAESLNAAIASSLIIFEALRQQKV